MRTILGSKSAIADTLLYQMSTQKPLNLVANAVLWVKMFV